MTHAAAASLHRVADAGHQQRRRWQSAQRPLLLHCAPAVSPALLRAADASERCRCTGLLQMWLPALPGRCPLTRCPLSAVRLLCLAPHRLRCRGPAIAVDQASVNDTAADVVVVAPSGAPPDGWARYDLTACPQTSGACQTFPCAPVPAYPNPANKTCALTGLQPSTPYNVTVSSRRQVAPAEGSCCRRCASRVSHQVACHTCTQAVAISTGGTVSPVSNVDTFSTKASCVLEGSTPAC